MPGLTDTAVLDAWSRNVDPWTTAVRGGEIETRTLVTNAAIVDAVRSLDPATGIDLGCGEGWLVRALPGVTMVGIDAIAALVEKANAAGGGDFCVLSFEQIAQGRLALAVDVAVCNFSLIGNEAGRWPAARSADLFARGRLAGRADRASARSVRRCAICRWLARRQLGGLFQRLRRCAAVVLPHGCELGRAVRSKRAAGHRHARAAASAYRQAGLTDPDRAAGSVMRRSIALSAAA